MRGRTDRPAQDHGAGRRPQSHRPGHRIRLLLRARRDGTARRRLRDTDGQLQSGNRLNRLRHLRPALLRAAHTGRRARNRRQGETRRTDRAVRRPDPAQARARSRSCRCADHRHHARHDRCRRGSRTLPAIAPPTRPEAATQPNRAHRGRSAGSGRADRLSAGGASELRAGRSCDGNRAPARRSGTLHARGGEGHQRFTGTA